jgi:hypothetical protein
VGGQRADFAGGACLQLAGLAAVLCTARALAASMCTRRAQGTWPSGWPLLRLLPDHLLPAHPRCCPAPCHPPYHTTPHPPTPLQNVAALTRSLPPRLRKVLSAGLFTPRVGRLAARGPAVAGAASPRPGAGSSAAALAQEQLGGAAGAGAAQGLPAGSPAGAREHGQASGSPADERRRSAVREQQQQQQQQASGLQRTQHVRFALSPEQPAASVAEKGGERPAGAAAAAGGQP